MKNNWKEDIKKLHQQACFSSNPEISIELKNLLLYISGLLEEQKKELLEEVEIIIENEATWYNTNNHIPDTELHKHPDNWDMLTKIVKDSLKEASERMIKDVIKLKTHG